MKHLPHTPTSHLIDPLPLDPLPVINLPDVTQEDPFDRFSMRLHTAPLDYRALMFLSYNH